MPKSVRDGLILDTSKSTLIAQQLHVRYCDEYGPPGYVDKYLYVTANKRFFIYHCEHPRPNWFSRVLCGHTDKDKHFFWIVSRDRIVECLEEWGTPKEVDAFMEKYCEPA